MNETPAIVKVSRDLSAIIELQTGLMVQAIHKAGARIDGHSLPGGEAMVALAHVADAETNERRVELREQEHLATCMRLDHSRCWTGSEDEDDSEPVLQTLLFWSEDFRATHGLPLEGRRPTVATEVNIIRGLLDWAWDNLMEWDKFAGDMESARKRLENMLHAGTRDTFAEDIECLTCETVVRRRMTDKGIEDNWYCTGCRRHLAPHEFYLAAAHAAQIALLAE